MNLNQLYKMNLNYITLTLLLLSVCSIYCYPTKPLNERSKELAWQAWLLIDDQNQNNNKHNDPDMFARRRITPKSVFIAPTFSPDKLPPCDAGYVYDTNGKCRMIVKIDEAPYLEFLLQKLNEKYADTDDTNDGSRPTPGPFQVNIPLGNAEKSAEQYDGHSDVVIPSDYTGFDTTKVKRTNVPLTKTDSKGTTIPDANTTLETTTLLQSTIVTEDVTINPDMYTTTMQDAADTGGKTTTTSTTTTTTKTTTTTEEMAHALFFINDAKNDSFSNDDIPLHEIPNGSIIIGSRIKDDYSVKDDEDTVNKNVKGVSAIINDGDVETPSSSSTSHRQSGVPLEGASQTSINYQYPPDQHQNLPKPDVDQKFYADPAIIMQNDKAGTNVNNNSTDDEEIRNAKKQFDRLYEDYIISRGSDLRANERHIFKNQRLINNSNNNNNQQQQPQEQQQQQQPQQQHHLQEQHLQPQHHLQEQHHLQPQHHLQDQHRLQEQHHLQDQHRLQEQHHLQDQHRLQEQHHLQDQHRLQEDQVRNQGEPYHYQHQQILNINNNDDQRVQQAGLLLNHRNRDKHFWNLPTDWGDVNVIISNKRAPLFDINGHLHQQNRRGSNLRRQQQQQQEQEQYQQEPKMNTEPLYRQVPSSELSYIFGGIRRMPRKTR